MRSDSLTRSSSASRTTVSPSAKAPSSATSVSSSIASGTSSGPTSVPSSGAEATSSSPTGSLSASVPGSSRSPRITAPMRSAIRRKPVRVQLSPTSSSTTREPGTSVAAATTKAAEEGSPGTTISSSSSSSTWETVSAAPSRSNGTRARRSRRSVWSRLGAGSRPWWSPSASIPASSTQDFTWALATGSS